MPDATQADIVDLYGANALVVADRDGDGVPDVDAVYRLALSQDVATTEHRIRYKDALSVLTKIADGRAALSLALPAPGEEGDPPVIGRSPIVDGGPERLFSFEKMRDL